MACIFCQIANKEVAADIVYEDGQTMAFLDVMPRNKGHTLVIPKEHYETIFEIPEDLMVEVYKTVKKVSMAARKAVNADGLNTIQSNIVTQGVPHFHVHVLPRFRGDNIPIVWESHLRADKMELRTVAERIKRLIQT